MKSKYAFLIPLAIISTGLVAWQVQSKPLESLPIITSLVQMIANPHSLDGKRVGVEGYLIAKNDEQLLFLTKEHADYFITGNAVTLVALQSNQAVKGRFRVINPELNHHYASLVGTFHAKEPNTLNLYAGEIGDVQRLKAINKTTD